MVSRAASIGQPHKVLVANRGEIAVRICRAISEIGWQSVVVYSADDASCLHTKKGDVSVRLGRQGAAAYLDIERMIEIARQSGCTMVHPGYGFLSERADFAERCEVEGLIFVGPSPQTLRIFGNKAEARELAAACRVPFPNGSPELSTTEEAAAFFAKQDNGAILLKAVAGGGGRGIRIARSAAEVAAAFERCRSEAKASFGDDRVFAEELIEGARHVEVQLVGDGTGEIAILGERECSLQRRHQKLVELAPSPGLSRETREALYQASERLGRRVRYRGLGTFEFLVCSGERSDKDRILFMEVNPRLQVEHTVTEEVTGVDLVQLQLRLAAGGHLGQETLPDPMKPRGIALQLRVNMESLQPDGSIAPAAGELRAFELPSGPGIRIDTAGYAGFRNSVSFDSLLAKIIVHVPSGGYDAIVRKAYRALCETRIDGIATNLQFLRNLLRRREVEENRVHTRFIDEHMQDLAGSNNESHPVLHFDQAHGDRSCEETRDIRQPAGSLAVATPATCRIVEIQVREGDTVLAGQPLAVTESMKMEFVIQADVGGTIVALAAKEGDSLLEGEPLLFLVANDSEQADHGVADDQRGLDEIRSDLARVLSAHERLMDEARPEAVARRRKTGQRTARENVADLCDEGSFLEYGGLAVAAQRSRRSIEELQEVSPADGLITGVGTVNADLFGADKTRCAVLAYDYTVFAGTQGYIAHTKKRRIIRLATKWQLPVIMFAEGGGGRPGDTDDRTGLKLYNATFWGMARLSGEVPIVAIASGRCFAGNAALLSCADLVIATENASIGMGGPAMIEGGGLGIVPADEVGPVSVQSRNGVIDVVVRDEEEAVSVAKQFLSYVQGSKASWTSSDQRLLRHIIPEEPRRAYDMRQVIDLLADTGSFLELRPKFGVGIITGFIRVEGHAFAVVANNPAHLAGAIDTDGSEKAARFLGLVESLGIPLLTLCDTPGFMVGPEAEKSGLVRSAGRMFVGGSKLTVPLFTIVVRKAYGLGAVAMVGGNSYEQMFCVAWPTGHFGKMGLEGHVKLAYRKELEAFPSEAERQARVRQMVAELHDRGSALNTAPYLSIDDVIDPLQSRAWLMAGLQVVRQRDRINTKGNRRLDEDPPGSAWCD
ncbi:acetyl-CoA carboxylase family protein [Bradyrhizobium iriomotense]|uniref:acetyl-CoA carboxylase family protein n=1 Tax=Bradyrhizobium iriomotense TaxID=441950 RepID=UPI001B8A0405|nr:carboxyl transferase domain-containing protein [Bradyrhizobium iriomotense]MBR0784740.1 ATP-grasp domain-containing protein [Bradyrhizobium iriomotense]